VPSAHGNRATHAHPNLAVFTVMRGVFSSNHHAIAPESAESHQFGRNVNLPIATLAMVSLHLGELIEVPKAITYKELDLNLPWQSFDITHELTN
jgi:hypothetical protein